MIEFKQITKADLRLIKPILAAHRTRLCDFSYGALVMWADYFNNQFAIVDGTLILRESRRSGRDIYSYPIGENANAVFKKLFTQTTQEQGALVLYPVEQNQLQAFNDAGAIIKRGEWFDYLYSAEELIKLEGKRFHPKRNHIKGFLRSNKGFVLEQITKENGAELAQFIARVSEGGGSTKPYESRKAQEVMLEIERYGMFGLAVRTSKGYAALAAGEVKDDTLFIHIEKGDKEINGAYAFIDNAFIKHACERFNQIKYVNKEEDMGDEGLKKSKESYYPIERLYKYEVTITKPL